MIPEQIDGFFYDHFIGHATPEEWEPQPGVLSDKHSPPIIQGWELVADIRGTYERHA